MNRSTRKAQAEETVTLVNRGSYTLPDGRTVSIREAVEECLAGTRLFTPRQLARLENEVLARTVSSLQPVLEVTTETTLAAARRLASASPAPVAALNFASAKNPGGGFLNGSHAQEESLARSSALYASLLRAPEYYQTHRDMRSCLYTDTMILSPCCPVFRGDQGELLENPFLVTFLTSAAPNAGALGATSRRGGHDEVDQIEETFRQRVRRVLALAASQGQGRLVLGAWGCGVFRNDPRLVARLFAEQLLPGRPFAHLFEHIVFAIYERDEQHPTVQAFRAALR